MENQKANIGEEQIGDDAQGQPQALQPNPGLKSLDRLVGAWEVSGPTISGQVIFEWMEGGFFLMQRFDLEHDGSPVKGIEIIGYERGWEALQQGEDYQPSSEITSRTFDNAGNTFTYAYEVDENTLTIWGGAKGSPAFYKGQWSPDGNTNSGQWVYPGGGYASTMTRAK